MEDGKTHNVSAKSLEPEDTDVLSDASLRVGSTLLWRVRGKKYTTTLLEIHGKDSKNPDTPNLPVNQAL